MLQIFDYTEKMAEDIIRIDKETFGEISCSPKELSDKIKHFSNYTVFLSYNNEQACGYIALLHVITLHYEAVWIDLLAVLPTYQSQGIAQQMIADAKEYVKNNFPKAEFMSALIRHSNSASLNASKKQGFSADGKGNFELLFSDL